MIKCVPMHLIDELSGGSQVPPAAGRASGGEVTGPATPDVKKPFVLTMPGGKKVINSIQIHSLLCSDNLSGLNLSLLFLTFLNFLQMEIFNDPTIFCW